MSNMREVLQKRRNSRGWSIRDMAEKTGITKSRYHQIELGQVDPTPGEAMTICKILNCEFAVTFPELVPVFQKEAAIQSALVAGIQIQAV